MREPATAEEFERYYRFRWRLLRAPFGQPPGSERDALDTTAIHVMIADENSEPLAIGRLHFNSPDEAQIRYMAVAPACQGQGFGSAVLIDLEERARRRGARVLVLNARDEAVGFYLRHGYQVMGAGDTLFGRIAHQRMRKTLPPDPLTSRSATAAGSPDQSDTSRKR